MRHAITGGIAVAALAAGLLIGAVAFSGSAGGPTPATGANTAPAEGGAIAGSSDDPAPKTVSIVPAKHDFGKMLEGEFRTTKLSIERPGDAKLRITRVYSPCPCIFVTTGKRILEPGEDTHVKVDLHSLTLNGELSFPVYVEVTEPEKGVMRADVTMEVARVPTQVMAKSDTMHLGVVKGAKTAEVKLLNLTKKAITLGEIATSIDGATVTVVEGKRIDAGRAHTIRLELDGAKLKKGPIRGEVTVETSCAAHRVILVPVDGTAR